MKKAKLISSVIIFSYIVVSLSGTGYVDDPPEPLLTPKGSDVDETFAYEEWSQEIIDYYDDYYQDKYEDAILLESTTAMYICHSYGWAHRKDLWIEEPKYEIYYQDGSYEEVDDTYLYQSKISYDMGSGGYNHTARPIIEADTISDYIISKWGVAGPLMKHKLHDDPYDTTTIGYIYWAHYDSLFPETPENFSLSGEWGEYVQLGWDAVDYVDYYNIYRKLGQGGSWGSPIGTHTLTSYTDYDIRIRTPRDQGAEDYYYRISAVNDPVGKDPNESAPTSALCVWGELMKGSSLLPKTFALRPNFPNPFNPVTKIQYELPKTEYVTLTVYNITGQVVAKLVDRTVEAGYHEAFWDASKLASGVYIYKLTAGSYTSVKRMMLVK